MTNARCGIDIGDSHRARRFTGCVIGLVRNSPTRQEHANAIRVGRAQSIGDRAKRFFPRDPRESTFAASTPHGVSESTKVAKFLARFQSQCRNIVECRFFDGIGTIHFEKSQTRQTKMNVIHRPVVQTSNAERTTVANALREHLPCVTTMALVRPCNFRHIKMVKRLVKTNAIRTKAHPKLGIDTAH